MKKLKTSSGGTKILCTTMEKALRTRLMIVMMMIFLLFNL